MVRDRQTGQFQVEKMDSHVKKLVELIPMNPNSSIGKNMLESNVWQSDQRWFALSHLMGSYADTALSASKIPGFVKEFNVNMSDFDPSDISKYSTFNKFFSRKLAKGVRPLAYPNNSNVLVSPADCRLTVFKTIKEAQKLWIKGNEFSVSKLIGYSRFAKPFKNGAIAICRLAPQDYHRWHMPVLGLQTHNIPVAGDLLSVNPIAIKTPEVNVFTENQRRLVLFKTHNYGKVAMVLVGATMVGSIKVDAKNKRIRWRGEDHGYFQFGGSTIILCFEKGRVEFDPDLRYNTKMGVETLVKARSRIGIATKPGEDRDVSIAQRKEPLLRQKESVTKNKASKKKVDMTNWKPYDFENEYPQTEPTEDLQPCCVIS